MVEVIEVIAGVVVLVSMFYGVYRLVRWAFLGEDGDGRG
jgi:hypothetical protein